MKEEEEEALVAFLILIGAGILIYFNAVVLDILNALPQLVSFFFAVVLGILNALCNLVAFCYLTLKQKYHTWFQEEQTRRRSTKLDKLMEQERNRKRDAPDMPTECPCCWETLFDSNGVAVDDKDIAKGLPCQVHLIHAECLKLVGQSLNADGKRYGISSAFGPRSGCPVCGQEVSFWSTTKKATDFGVFWWHKIQKCIEQVGRDNGPVSVDVVMDMLRNDPSLTRQQKSLIFRAPCSEEELRFKSENYVFENALVEGGSRIYSIKVTDDDGEFTTGMAAWPPVWDYDRQQGTLWMKKWS